MPMRLIVGLGNPGRDYIQTRHNAGYWWLERCAVTLGVSMQPDAKCFGLVGSGRDAQSVHLLMPQTFMNASGKSVGAFMRFYKIAAEDLLVVHDELDLLPGDARLKQGGGHGGHNGLKDIINVLGTQQFWRLRLGIGHPGHRDAVSDWVLSPPRADELALIEDAMARSLVLLPQLLQGDFPAAMRELHTQPKR
jgi:PTH1 family peptidyl-tRNA hydrolase